MTESEMKDRSAVLTAQIEAHEKERLIRKAVVLLTEAHQLLTQLDDVRLENGLIEQIRVLEDELEDELDRYQEKRNSDE